MTRMKTRQRKPAPKGTTYCWALLMASTAMNGLPGLALAASPALTIDGRTETVNGAGGGTQASPWDTGAQDLWVGDDATGGLAISNGGTVSSHAGYVGHGIGSTGNVNVAGSGSSWTNSSGGLGLFVGYQGTGTLTVSDGAHVTSPSGSIGYGDGVTGSVTVTGAGSTWESGNLLSIGYTGNGTLTISNGGVVTTSASKKMSAFASAIAATRVPDPTVYIAMGANSTGTLNIGAAQGSAAVAPGTLNAGAIRFGYGADVGTGTIVFNHTSSNYSFAPAIIGNGTINHVAGTTSLTGDVSGFTGTTNLLGGLLNIDGTLGGTVNSAGGTLGGSGTTSGSVSMTSGGTLAPGHSVGTLNVANVSFAPGSTYAVELNDGGFVAGTNNDFVNAADTITITGGTVKVSPENGTDTGSTYTLGTYTIATAAGGVTGTFDTVSDSFTFLDFNLTYDANNVFLTSVQGAAFTDVASTANQKAAAAGAQSLGGGNAIYDALLTVKGDDNARKAFDALSGEGYATVRSGFLQDSRYLREAMLFGGTDGPLRGWASGYGAVGRFAGDGNAAAANLSSGGLIGGIEQSFAEGWIGASFQAGISGVSIPDRATTASSTDLGAGVYGGMQLGQTSFRLGAAYIHHNVSTTRDVAIGGFTDTLTAQYASGTAQFFGEVAHRFDLDSWSLTPYAQAAYIYGWTGAFDETGGAAALHTAASTDKALFTTLGLRAERQISLPTSGTAMLNGSVGWRHAFGATPTAQNSFATGSAFTVSGASFSADALLIGAGLDFALEQNTSLDLSYSGVLTPSGSDHALSASFKMTF